MGPIKASSVRQVAPASTTNRGLRRAPYAKSPLLPGVVAAKSRIVVHQFLRHHARCGAGVQEERVSVLDEGGGAGGYFALCFRVEIHAQAEINFHALAPLFGISSAMNPAGGALRFQFLEVAPDGGGVGA